MGFVQIVEFTSPDLDAVRKIDAAWEKATQGKRTARRQIVTRDRKATTSYLQRRLQIGYNRAASLIERMEKEGVIGRPNHAGKREILVGGDDNEDY